MINSTSSNGFFSIHICKYCKMIEINSDDLHVIHIKSLRRIQNGICNGETGHLTNKFKKMLKEINH